MSRDAWLPLRAFSIIWLLTVMVASHRPARCQELPATQPSTQPVQLPVLSLADLSADTIQTKLKLLDTSSDLPQAARTELRSLYEQTLAQFKKSDDLRRQISHLRLAGQQAPSEIAQIRARLKQAQSRPATQPVSGVPEELTLDELKAELTTADAQLATQEQAWTRAVAEVEAWIDRKVTLPESIIDANTRLNQITQKVSQPPAAGIYPEIKQARQLLLAAQQESVKQELRAYEDQLNTSGLLTDLLQARLEEAQQLKREALARVDDLHQRIDQLHQVEVAERKRLTQERLKKVPDSIRQFVKTNSDLIDEELKLASSMRELSVRSRGSTRLLDELDRSLRVLQNKVEMTTNSAYLGPLLYRSREQLPDMDDHERHIQWIQQEIPSVQVRLLELEEERADFEDLEQHQVELMTILEESDITRDRDEIAAKVAEALDSRVESLDSLKRNYETYWNDLVVANIAENRVIAKTLAIHHFINERVLWIRSNPPLTEITMPERFLPQVGTLKFVLDALVNDAKRQATSYLAIVLGLALWFLLRRKMRFLLRRINERVARPYTDSFLLTIQALLIELYRCLPIPAILWFLGNRLGHAAPLADEEAYQIALGLALALTNLAAALLVYTFFLRLCKSGGVAETHFLWDPGVVARLRHGITFLLAVGAPLGVLANLAQEYPDPAWRSLVGRVSFVGLMLFVAGISHYLLHPSRGVLKAHGKDSGLFGLKTVKVACYFLMIGLTAVLAVASGAGYQLLATYFSRRVGHTIWLVLGLVVLRSLIVRFVAVSQRRLAIREARERHAASGETSTANASGSSAVRSDEDSATALAHISSQTQTLLRWLTTFGLILGAWTIWQDVFPAFSFVNEVELWTYTLEVPTTATDATGVADTAQPTRIVKSIDLADLLFAMILAVFTVILATNGPNVLEIVLLARLPIDAGARFAIAALLRYVIIVAGLVLSFQTLGIGWSKVQWLAAAITVGLGFGLQEIFANFVSGLIILFERPVRIGDVVTVGGVDGKITRIQMRATTLTDWNRRELIVPNKELITGQIVNWTLSDPVTRVDIAVGIAYGSDTRSAREKLLEVAKASPYVLPHPQPMAIFRQFGESSLDFELRVHIPNRDIWPQMIDDLHTRIDNAFREAGIEIAFPQRDIHVRSIVDGRPVSPTERIIPSSRASGLDVDEAGQRGALESP